VQFLTLHAASRVLFNIKRVVWVGTYSCVLALTLSMQVAHSAEDAAAKQAKFERVKKSIDALQVELKKIQSSRDALNQTLEQNERAIQELNDKTEELEDKLDGNQSRLDTLQSEQVSLGKKKSAQQSLIEDYLNSAYRLGQHSQIRVLLNQQDPAQVARMLKYYQAFSHSRAEKISDFIATIDRLKALEPEIAQQQKSLQATYASLQEQRRSLKTSQSERTVVLDKLDKQMQNQQARLKQLIRDREHLEKVLSVVIAEMNSQELNADVSNFAQLKGQLPWPTNGKQLNRFGGKRSGTITWQGLQFGAKSGTEVVSIHHGQVVFSDYLRGHGLLLIIDHGAGYISLYAHNQNLYKDIGAWVETGEIVATVGDTGGRRETALYFELRYQGKPTNPIRWFKPA